MGENFSGAFKNNVKVTFITYLSTPACIRNGCRVRTKLFEVKLRLIRRTDHKNGTPSAATSEEAQACEHYKIVEACAFFQ